MGLLLVLLSLLALAAALPPDPSTYDVIWTAPTANKSMTDAMPTGNGRVVVLAWAEPALGALAFYVRSPLALALDTQVYTLARVGLALSPNPCAAPAAPYQQRLHLADGSISLTCGSVTVAVLVDASADAIVVTARDASGAPFALNATLESVRPASRFNYKLDFQCQESSSGPDVLLAALPAPAPRASLALYHVNSAAAGDWSLFNASMRQQGLAPLLASEGGAFSDPLEGRIFGLGMTGAAGAEGLGAPLVRAGPSSLLSAAPAPAFALLLAVRVDGGAGGDGEAWAAALAAALAAPPAPTARAAAAAAWWAAFWARAYFVPGAQTPAPPPSPSPPPPPPPLRPMPWAPSPAAAPWQRARRSPATLQRKPSPCPAASASPAQARARMCWLCPAAARQRGCSGPFAPALPAAATMPQSCGCRS